MAERTRWLPPKLAFILVFFCLGELGEGLNIFEGVYLVSTGWNEGSVGVALSLVGLTALIVQPWAGDWVDNTTVDRRIFLATAAMLTAMSASAVLLVREGNRDHMLIFICKIIEGVAASFIIPCVAALTLATFGPSRFDAVMASIMLWGHIGSVVMAILVGTVAYFLYPNAKYCFLVIAAAALFAVIFVPHLPQGDPLMGRGFHGKEMTIDEDGYHLEIEAPVLRVDNHGCGELPPEAASYWETFSNSRTSLLCFTGFFYHFADANVVLVLGELMGQVDEGVLRRNAVPLIAGAIVTSQLTMALATSLGDWLTMRGLGRKPLCMVGLLSLPVRCALIILWKDAGDTRLLSTQVLDGLGGGFFGLIHPLLVADITFGSGRFNLVMGLTASFFGLGSTLSSFLGQLIVEKFGHTASLACSLGLSFIPIVLFSFMPETLGDRNHSKAGPNAMPYDPTSFKLSIVYTA